MRARLFVVAPFAAIALTCVACSSGTSTPDGGATPQTIAWTDKVCGAMKSVQNAGGTQPAIDQNDPAAAVRGLADYFGGVVTAVQGARTTLQDAGPSPVANTQPDITRIEGELGQVQTAFQTARDKLKGIDPADPQALATGMSAAMAPVQQLDVTADPIGLLRKNPAFDAVAKQVPSCSA